MYSNLDILDNTRMYYLDTREAGFDSDQEKLINAGYDRGEFYRQVDQKTGEVYENHLFAKTLFALRGYENGKYKTFTAGTYQECLEEKREMLGWC